MISAVPIMRAAPGWSPSPFQAPASQPPTPAPSRGPEMAQAVVATPTTPPGAVAVAPPSFIDSALVAALFAGVGTVAYGTLTAGAYKANWKKSTIIFGAMTALLGVKTVLDIADARVR